MIRYLQRVIKTHHNHELGRWFSGIAFFGGFGNALFLTVLPLTCLEYLKNESLVGYYFSFVAFIVLLGSIASTAIFQNFSKESITKWSLGVLVVAIGGLSIASSVYGIAGLHMPREIAVILFMAAVALLLGSLMRKNILPEAEGAYYAAMNWGWILGPILSGVVAKTYGTSASYLLASCAYAAALFLFWISPIFERHPHLKHEKLEESLIDLFKATVEYFKDFERTKVFLLALGVNLWWAIGPQAYIPLEVSRLGFSSIIVGLIVAGSYFPLVLFEARLAKLAEKKSIRFSAIIGFVIVTSVMAMIPLLYGYPIIALIFFCLVGFGLAFLEPLQETYFFRVVKPSERERLFGIYNIAQPVGVIFGSALAGWMFALGAEKGLWWGSAILFALFIPMAISIRK